MESKIPVICVAGPTASGKTALAVRLAQRYDGEVVSADSMQIYKNMDIATAKPDEEEMCGIPHHLIGFLDPAETFSVAQYVAMAASAIADIHARGKLPIIAGGTGLYMDSLINNISFSENDSDEQLREELRQKAEKYGVQSLVDELAQFDPESAARIEPNNVKRVIRAIEIYKTTGVTMTEQNRRSRLIESPYNAIKIGLKAHDRQYLYDRINKRVDIMAERGLIAEAKSVLSQPCSQTAQKAIGYKELVPYLCGEASLEQALDELKKQSRRYAKRQLTWFLRDKSVEWFDIDMYSGFEELFSQVCKYIDDRREAEVTAYGE